MVAKGKCKCGTCGLEFDPTVEFERCLNCGGSPVLRVRRYQCRNCGSEIKSKFLFDGLIFNAEYFRQKVTESRQRKKEQRERVREMLAESKSADLPLGTVDLAEAPGLVDALNGLTAGLDMAFAIESHNKFDLTQYENHIRTHVRDVPLKLVEIPLLSDDKRRDLIWRFIAVIFLAHTAVVDIWQEGQDIMVIKHEVNRKGQDILGELEETDGIERPAGGIEAW